MSGFVEAFTRYLKRRTDCPSDFHVHAALVTLATAMGNRVWTHGWTRPVYPNLWAVVIAPSGYGKSAPLDMTERLLHKAQLDERVLPNSFSYEALLQAMQKQPVGTFVTQEFANFVSMMGRDYNAGCRELLAEIYDCPPKTKRTTMRGDVVIEKPCLSILGASSPSWFAESLRGRSPEGGFLERIVFCPSTQTGEPVDHPGPPDEGTEAVLADHLRRAATLGGVADFTAVTAAFSAWQRDQRAQLRRAGAVEFGGMLSRAPLLALKASILFRVSREADGLKIGPDDLDRAIKYVTYSHRLALDWLDNEVARDADEADRIKLVQRLREKGGRMPWSALLHASHLRADKFARAIDTLRQSNRVRTNDERAGTRGAATKYVELVEQAQEAAPWAS